MPKYDIETINNKKPESSRLTAISFSETKYKPTGQPERYVKCKCDCGENCDVKVNMVVSGQTRSCGCLFKEIQLKTVTKYNPLIPSLHRQYKHMIQRCYNPNNCAYKYYGGQGVVVCEEWRHSYQSFLTWAINNGWQKGLHIDKDKIKKGCKIYSPETVSFLTPYENNQYRRKRGTALI